MTNKTRAGFLRHFLSGFALGAVALVGFQISQPEDKPMYPPVTADASVTPAVS
ncbi:hypothetical protein [Sphingomonas spermidinifaciens]|uniref:hypothetical protein n=1 Tax=Sphingomonas spermidinifaciens TaxID=1141889 RepID=UPI0015964F44|nr:hypothetical protein [Sphingomonas spermidinifaciens]